MTKEQLTHLFERANEQVELLRTHKYEFIDSHLDNIEREMHEFVDAGTKLIEEGDTLQIGIVGQVKAGKSSFLNALFFDGENILPRASTPMTAGLTILEYGEQNALEVDYFTQKDWSFFERDSDAYKRVEEECKKEEPNASATVLKRMIEERTTEQNRVAYEMISKCSLEASKKIDSASDTLTFQNYRELQNGLEKYVGAAGKFTSVVKSIRVKLKDERLKGLRIVDTPGVNDPVLSRENRTRTFLHSCHGVFLLSSSSDFFGSADVQFLNNRVGTEGIAKVVLLASKFDSVLQDLGSQYEMQESTRISLAEAADKQNKLFVDRLNETKGQLKDGFKKGQLVDIELNYTSGISYSLAHKDESEWDDMEKNVAAQMKRFYPNDFATPEQAKQSFNELANIADIEEDYLRGVFLNNKESIMREKMSVFFDAHQQRIKDALSSAESDLNLRRKDIDKKSLDEIEQQCETQKKMFTALEEKFENIITDFNSSLQNTLKDIGLTIQLNEHFNPPMENVDVKIKHKGFLWGHNITEMSYSIINSYETREQVDHSIKAYIQEWYKAWQEVFDNTTKTFSNEMLDLICKKAKETADSRAFDDDFYRRMLEKTMSQLNFCSRLDLDPLLEKYKETAYDKIVNNYFVPPCQKDEKEAVAQQTLYDAAQAYTREVMNNIHQAVFVPIKRDVKTEANKSIGKVTQHLDSLKDKFGKTLNQNADYYLNELKKQLQNKQASLEKIDAVITDFQKLNVLFK
jgi:hypothetical protein